jgi:tRNA(fMet)-specific endonuclease VapC
MILLDTDHLSILGRLNHSQREGLVRRMESSAGPHCTTIISVEEHFRGWISSISKRRQVHDQVLEYTRLRDFLMFIQKWEIIPFDSRAADEFLRLRKQCRRMATADLKIAAITLVNDALLLSAYLRDFRQVPNLRVENWLT